jgi:hypothetical protein
MLHTSEPTPESFFASTMYSAQLLRASRTPYHPRLWERRGQSRLGRNPDFPRLRPDLRRCVRRQRRRQAIGFTSAGYPLAPPSLVVGTGANHAVTHSPLVDSFGGKVYAFSGDRNSAGQQNGVVLQTNASLSTSRLALPGLGGQRNMHLRSLNEAYFNVSTNQIGTTSEWFLYTCGVENVGGPTKRAILLRVGFDANRVMNRTADTKQTGSNHRKR